MNLLLQRIYDNGDSTIGALFINNELQCFTLEDQHQDKKIKGETRIPAGIYQLKIRQELTDLTKKYRLRFPWFKYHIEITNIPNFVGVYLHIGNNDDNSAGCVLTGNTVNKDGTLLNSTTAFTTLYMKLYPLLEKGEVLKLHIQDELVKKH